MQHTNLSASFLIIGGDGQLGRALCERLQADGQTYWFTSRRPSVCDCRQLFLDLAASPDDWPAWPNSDVAVLCAGVTNQAECQQDPIGTALINVERVLELSRRLQVQGTFVIFVSSNQVFDGSVAHISSGQQISPSSEYGRQKAVVERELLSSGHPAAVVRFGKLLHPGYALFQTWIEQLQVGQAIHPFSDAGIAPLPMSFAAELLLTVGRVQSQGIVQATGNCDVTYAEIATRIARRYGADERLVQPRFVTDLSGSMLRLPRQTTLAPSPELSAWGLTVPDVWATIDAAS